MNRLKPFAVFALAAASVTLTFAQQPLAGPGGGNSAGPDGGMQEGPPPMRPNRPPMERAFHAGPPGRWWTDPEMAKQLGLTADQQKKMDGIFQQSRLKLIDLVAAVQKQEALLEPLLQAEQPDESKVLSQIDRVAQARAELEKANARMLLGLRSVLSQEQWKKLQADRPMHDHGPHEDGKAPFRGGDRPGPGH